MAIMDSQPEDLSLLMRLKKRRRTYSMGQPVTNHGAKTTGTPSSLSAFVQSALKHTPSGGREGGEASRAASGARSVSSRRKKQRIGSCQLERWPEMVGLSGYSEEEEEEEEEEGCGDAIIDAFSDSGSDIDNVIEGESVEEGEGEYVSPPPSSKKKKKSKINRQIIEGAKTITSLRVAETVDEFDSCSFESSISSEDHTHQPRVTASLHTSTPHTSTPHTSTPHTSTPAHSGRHSVTVRDFYLAAVGSHSKTTPTTPEYESITTPPSSPEVVEGERRTTTTSEWMRQIKLEQDDLTSNETTMVGCNNMTLWGLGDSVERVRRGGRWRGGRMGRVGRVVPGGLAEIAERVSLRESSDVTFWEHRSRHINDEDIDVSVCLTVEVCSLTTEHSLKVAECRILAQQQLPVPVRTAVLDMTRDDSCGDDGGGLGRAAGVSEGRVMEGVGEGGVERGGLERGGLDGGRLERGGLDGGRLERSGAADRGGEGRGGLDGGGVEVRGDGAEGEMVTVLFSLRCAKFLDLQAGHHVRIHPPWQSLTVPFLQCQRVVLCTHFCQALTSTHHHPPTSHSTPHNLTHVTTHRFPHPAASSSRENDDRVSELLPHTTSSSHTNSSIQSRMVPIRLFPSRGECLTAAPGDTMASTSHPQPHIQCITGSNEHDIEHQNTSSQSVVTHHPHSPANDSLLPTLSTAPAISGGDDRRRVGTVDDSVCRGLVDAVQCAVDRVSSLKCRVLRVYRRHLYSTSGTLTLGGTIGHGLLTRRTATLPLTSRWCLLLCDVTGTLCELQVSNTSHPNWRELVRQGEGEVYHFTDVRVSSRTTPTRSPELFSLMMSLSGQSLSSEVEPAPPQSVPIPPYCRVLVSGPESVPVPVQSGEDIPAVTSHAFSAVRDCQDHVSYGVTRGSVYARVVHYQPEVPITVLNPSTPLTPHYGHHLFVVTPSHPSPSSQTSQHPHDSQQDNPHSRQLLRLYVKPHYPREDVEHLFRSPGQRIMIRDVEMRTERGVTGYSVDACSVIHSPSLSTAEHVVYPQYKFSGDEESVLLNLLPPTLPPFTSHRDTGTITTFSGVIVGIDEDAAFSWPECDSCGNDRLATTDSSKEGEEILFCDSCQVRVLSPSVHLQLAVYIKPSQHSTSIVYVRLTQATIRGLLPVSSKSLNEGFDVSHVLNQSVGLEACYVQGTGSTKYGQLTPLLQEISFSTHQSPMDLKRHSNYTTAKM